jgi:hypothetical protein
VTCPAAAGPWWCEGSRGSGSRRGWRTRALSRGAGACRSCQLGVQSETQLPFASLHQLLRPVLGHVDQLPLRLRSPDRRRGARRARDPAANGRPTPALILARCSGVSHRRFRLARKASITLAIAFASETALGRTSASATKDSSANVARDDRNATHPMVRLGQSGRLQCAERRRHGSSAETTGLPLKGKSAARPLIACSACDERSPASAATGNSSVSTTPKFSSAADEQHKPRGDVRSLLHSHWRCGSLELCCAEARVRRGDRAATPSSYGNRSRGAMSLRSCCSSNWGELRALELAPAHATRATAPGCLLPARVRGTSMHGCPEPSARASHPSCRQSGTPS